MSLDSMSTMEAKIDRLSAKCTAYFGRNITNEFNSESQKVDELGLLITTMEEFDQLDEKLKNAELKALFVSLKKNSTFLYL